MSDIEKIINDAWENRDNVNQDSDQSLKNTKIAEVQNQRGQVAKCSLSLFPRGISMRI